MGSETFAERRLDCHLGESLAKMKYFDRRLNKRDYEHFMQWNERGYELRVEVRLSAKKNGVLPVA